MSDFLFLSSYVQGGAASNLILWIYHNSFSGGNATLTISDITTMPGFYALNNVISHSREMAPAIKVQFGEVDPRTGEAPEQGSLEQIGAFDYNAISSQIWGYGEHNQIGIPPIWDDSQIERGFVIPDGHPAKASGIDVSRPFVIDGRTYGPLPGFEPGYFQGAAPDMGWINRGEETNGGGGGQVASLVVTPVKVVSGASVKVAWTGSTNPHDWIALFPEGAPNEDESYSDWKYTNCQQEASSITPSGLCTFQMVVGPGEYEFRMFSNNSFNLMANEFVTVAEEEPEPEPKPEPEMVEVMIPAWVRRSDIVLPAKGGPAKKRRKDQIGIEGRHEKARTTESGYR